MPPQRLPEESSPADFRWIVDGHNAIFAVPNWEDLQLSGQRREARRSLEAKLQSFGRAIGSQVWVVYDGNESEHNPDAVSLPHVKSFYSLPPEEADDRIRYLVKGCLHQGERPVVVSSDQRTLVSTLPPGVRSLSIDFFFRRIYRRLIRTPEKWEPGDLTDIERHFLQNSPFEEDRRQAADGISRDHPSEEEKDNGAGAEEKGR